MSELLDIEIFSCALLQYRNTPDYDTWRLLAQVLRDFVPVVMGRFCHTPKMFLTKQHHEEVNLV